jgi:hypothetical protein
MPVPFCAAPRSADQGLPVVNNVSDGRLHSIAPQHLTHPLEKDSRAVRTIWEIFQSGRPLTYVRSTEEQPAASNGWLSGGSEGTEADVFDMAGLVQAHLALGEALDFLF